ncbi:MAG TPA: alpha/beta hydrolase-fold protein [Acidimicrobiales bacterium]
MRQRATARRGGALIGCVGLIVASILTLSEPAAAQTSSAPAPAQLVTITIPAPDSEIPSQWLSYPGPPRANVLLPAGYNPQQRYPLLVLLSGLANNYASYAQDGIVAKIEASDLDAVVVMPEGGNGWYANWLDNGQPGSPAWETYELDVVLPTILDRYPILPGRQYHAIAGFSMGGLGAVYLGGRLPGFFGTVATLSGFVDTQYFAPLTDPAMGFVAQAPLKGDGSLSAVYGDPFGFYANGHNPTLLAMNLKQTRVFESTGTGVPSGAGLSSLGGNYGQDVAVVGGSALEAPIIYPMNEIYHAALTAAGVDVTYQVHPGGHDLPDFDNEFDALLAWGLFKPLLADPASWVNDTVATSGQIWGIGYRFAQPPSQVVRIQQSGSTLSISAAGSAVTVTTGSCTIATPTPATIDLSPRRCA